MASLWKRRLRLRLLPSAVITCFIKCWSALSEQKQMPALSLRLDPGACGQCLSPPCEMLRFNAAHKISTKQNSKLTGCSWITEHRERGFLKLYARMDLIITFHSVRKTIKRHLRHLSALDLFSLFPKKVKIF